MKTTVSKLRNQTDLMDLCSLGVAAGDRFSLVQLVDAGGYGVYIRVYHHNLQETMVYMGFIWVQWIGLGENLHRKPYGFCGFYHQHIGVSG